MSTIEQVSLASALLLSVATMDAHAALYDRGNGMIYDSTQNITWLQDANYAYTSGYSTANGGAMTWDQATAWASGLVYRGLNGWRLASANLINRPCFAFDGTCDVGYNNTRSEIGHLYTELGNIPFYSTAGNVQEGFGFTHTGPFSNIQARSWYWEAEQYAGYTGNAWYFDPGLGEQSEYFGNYVNFAWAVRAGDIASVPVPAAAWLFGSGLLGLAGVTRQKFKAA